MKYKPSIKDLILLKKIDIINTREQIQEDIITYVNPLLDNDYEFTNLNVDDLCQIVVDNFNKNLGGEFDRRREAEEKGLYDDSITIQ